MGIREHRPLKQMRVHVMADPCALQCESCARVVPTEGSRAGRASRSRRGAMTALVGASHSPQPEMCDRPNRLHVARKRIANRPSVNSGLAGVPAKLERRIAALIDLDDEGFMSLDDSSQTEGR